MPMTARRAVQGTSLRLSVALAFGYSYVTRAITFVVGIILARYFLGPREFGAFSVCMSGYLFLQGISEFGITRFIVQQKSLDTDTLRATMTVLVAGNAAIAAGLLAVRGWAAKFFGAPEIATILAILAVAALFVPALNLGDALLLRASRFPALFVTNVGSVIVGAVVGLGAAAAGQGAASLGWLTLAQTLVRTTLTLAFCREVRRVYPGLARLRSVLAFGSPLTIVTFYSALLARLPDILIGRLIDLTAAGLYGRASGLAEQLRWAFYTGGLAAILPEVARRFHAGESLVGPYLRLTAYATGLIWPAAGFLSLLALPLTRLVFGPAWSEMAPLLSVLSLSYAVYSMIVLYNEVLQLQRRLWFYVTLEVSHGTVGLILFVVGAMLGLFEAALSRLVYFALFAALNIVVLRHAVGHRYGEVAAVYARSLAVTAIALLPTAAAALARMVWPLGDAASVLPVAVVSPGFWYLGLRLARHPLRDEVDRAVVQLRSRLGL
jgi:O-antigen/teichoic acid export membrane protein